MYVYIKIGIRLLKKIHVVLKTKHCISVLETIYVPMPQYFYYHSIVHWLLHFYPVYQLLLQNLSYNQEQLSQGRSTMVNNVLLV